MVTRVGVGAQQQNRVKELIEFFFEEGPKYMETPKFTFSHSIWLIILAQDSTTDIE